MSKLTLPDAWSGPKAKKAHRAAHVLDGGAVMAAKVHAVCVAVLANAVAAHVMKTRWAAHVVPGARVNSRMEMAPVVLKAPADLAVYETGRWMKMALVVPEAPVDLAVCAMEIRTKMVLVPVEWAADLGGNAVFAADRAALVDHETSAARAISRTKMALADLGVGHAILVPVVQMKTAHEMVAHVACAAVPEGAPALVCAMRTTMVPAEVDHAVLKMVLAGEAHVAPKTDLVLADLAEGAAPKMDLALVDRVVAVVAPKTAPVSVAPASVVEMKKDLLRHQPVDPTKIARLLVNPVIVPRLLHLPTLHNHPLTLRNHLPTGHAPNET